MTPLHTQVIRLVQKEFRLEFRDRSAFFSILLYLVSTLFICYQSFREINENMVWSALAWIIFLFAGMNAVTRSFYHENKSRQTYFYTLVSPRALILSKMIYNVILLLALDLIGFGLYYTFFGNFALDWLRFLPVLLLGSSGIALTLTFTSAIGSKTQNNAGILGVISFPVILPLLLIILRASHLVIAGETEKYGAFLLALGALNLVVLVLGYVLYPYLWKE